MAAKREISSWRRAALIAPALSGHSRPRRWAFLIAIRLRRRMSSSPRRYFRGGRGTARGSPAKRDQAPPPREAPKPIREKTGGSTFKNPPGEKAWVLIDKAGCRGLVLGDAEVSPMHCNFL